MPSPGDERRGGELRVDDLDRADDVARGDVVDAQHALFIRDPRRDVRQQQRRGVGGQDHLGRAKPVERLEDGLLGLQHFLHRLVHHEDALHGGLQRGLGGHAGQELVDLGGIVGEGSGDGTRAVGEAVEDLAIAVT